MLASPLPPSFLDTPLRVFYTSVSWWFFYWSLSDSKSLQSPGLFSVFWPILFILLTVWSPLVLWFLNLPFSLSILWGLFQLHHLLLISPSPSCSFVCLLFFFSSLAGSWYLSLFYLSFNFSLWSTGTAKSTIRQFLFFLFLLFFFFFFGNYLEVW